MRSKYFLNPFTRIAGIKSLLIGLTGLLLTTYIAFITGTHFNGFLNIDFAKDSDYWVYLLENLSSWFFAALSLHISGLIFSGSKIRVIDTFGTTLLSRIPLVIVPLIRTFPVFQSFVIQSWEMYVVIGFYLVSLAWVIVLLFNAFKTSCNLQNKSLVASFIVSLILSEVCTKIFIKYILS